MVTAYGSGNHYCKVVDIGTNPGPGAAVVDIECFDSSGAPIDARFTNSYWTTEMFTPC
jgi:hypothetical protein